MDILKIMAIFTSALLTIVALILNRKNFHLEFKIEIGQNKKEH
ncbi:hypothetical protein [Thermoanaerobacterium thermosaccharolyticum]